jgi:hypothetical protein
MRSLPIVLRISDHSPFDQLSIQSCSYCDLIVLLSFMWIKYFFLIKENLFCSWHSFPQGRRTHTFCLKTKNMQKIQGGIINV